MANSVLRNAKALELDHIPETLQHRDGELEELRAALQPIADGFRPENAMLYGPSGTGKTTIAKHIVNDLDETVFDFRWGYVDVMGSSSRRDLYYELARELDLHRLLPRREGADSSRILQCFRECEDDIVMIVDEVQFLDDEVTLGPLLNLPDASVVGITLDQNQWLADCHQGIVSRVRSARPVTLDPYGPDQLADIVQHRVELGLEAGVVADGSVETIAERAGGDARMAITLLRRGAREVRSGNAKQITPELIDDVEEGAREAILERYRSQLGTYKRLLFDIVREAGEIQAEELHATFEARCDDPPSKRQRQRYLQGLATYGLIEVSGEKRGRTYSTP